MPSVLVVGAGPTGLTAAVELARHGIKPRVIERRQGTSNLSRAVGITPRSMELLSPSGVAAAIAAESVKMKSFILHEGARRVAEVPLNLSQGDFIHALAQDRTEAHLAGALERYGGTVEYGTAFEGLEQDQDGVTVCANGKSDKYDYVIGADGIRSGVRSALGVSYEGTDLPGEWSIADVDAEPPAGEPAGRMYFLPEGNFGICVPLESRRFRLVATVPNVLEVLPVEMKILNVRREGTFTISVRQVDAYTVGRVHLAGDAAHCHSPVGGRGMNLGIADAADLAGRIASGDTAELAAYHSARHAAGQRVIRFTEALRGVIMSRGLQRQLAVLGMRIVGSTALLQRGVAYTLARGA